MSGVPASLYFSDASKIDISVLLWQMPRIFRLRSRRVCCAGARWRMCHAPSLHIAAPRTIGVEISGLHAMFLQIFSRRTVFLIEPAGEM